MELTELQGTVEHSICGNMMEASISQDPGHTSPLPEALSSPSIPSSSSSSPPSLPSHLPARPCRPKPLPPTVKSTQPPSRPPLPPSTPPSLPPPLPPVSKPPPPLSSNPPPPSVLPPLALNHPPPSLPPPLSPTPVSPSALLSLQSTVSDDLTPSFPPSPPPLPLSQTVASSSSATPPQLSPVIPPSSTTPPLLSPIDRLVGSTSVWQPKGLSQDQTTSIIEKELAGAFLVHSTEDKGITLSVRLPNEQGTPLIHSLMVKQHKTFVHLDGSCLVFDDIIKLISFYCASRDILTVPLRLPWAITTATKREELEVISSMGPDFWTSSLNQQAKEQDLVLDQDHNSLFLYVNPVTVEDGPSKDLNHSSISKHDIIPNQNITASLQNEGAPQKVSPEDQTKTTPNKEIKYKRPPPRPPSLGAGSGMGLLFSSSQSLHTSSSVTPAAVRKEEGRGGRGEREERKSMSTPPSPLRPPVSLQNRATPSVPPAPLSRTSSRKRADREVGEGTEREKGQNPAEKTEKKGGVYTGKENKGSTSSLLVGEHEQDNSSQNQEEGVEKDREKTGKEDKKEEKDVKTDKEEDKQQSSSQCPSSVKKPSRPVPPPRRKSCSPNTPVCPNPARRGSGNQSAGVRVPPPSPARRSDVSLYSPQGGAAVVTDPDSCSTSSTEEEGEPNQEQEQNHNRPTESRPKAAVRKQSTTVMLGRARHRLSSVLTGLISHERRLTQRIVGLARDPLSYFGNLVKEHRAFTLETMSNHSSSTELLQEIRQMMTQLKSYLLQSAELQAMLELQHQHLQDKLESIVEAALCKSVLKPLREPIYQKLEKLHINDSSLKQLTQNQSVVLGSTTTALGVTTAVPEASAMEKISIKLNNLHLEYSPQKKIELLLKACKIIYDSMSISSPGRAHGADDFLPVMMYVLARSDLSALQLDVEYMMELMDPSLTIGEGSYYLTTTYGALEHIKAFDQQRSATRQLSREVQDSIHRWERRRTLNQERMAQGSIRDFLTVCCPEIGTNPKTLGVLPDTTIEQLAEQCAARFDQDSYTLSVYTDGVQRLLASTELAISVKNSCQPGDYCFVYHPIDPSNNKPVRSCPSDPPPAPPAESLSPPSNAAIETVEQEAEEESLISL